MTLKEKVNVKKFNKQTLNIEQFKNDYHTKIDCQPVDQRLPVTVECSEKREGTLLMQSYSILILIQITLTSILDSKYDYESVDRSTTEKDTSDQYLNNKFKVNGKYFNELSEEKQRQFLNYEIVLSIYEPLDAYTKDFIFRTLNETTDVNHMQMLNSYNDLPIANYIRELVRVVHIE